MTGGTAWLPLSHLRETRYGAVTGPAECRLWRLILTLKNSSASWTSSRRLRCPSPLTKRSSVLGHLFKTQLLPNKFNDEFNAPDGYGKPVPRTLNAALYEADGMTLRLSFKSDSGKGVSPAEYLRSALYGGEATDTAIHSAIQNITGMYPVPAYGNLRALGAMTQYGDIRPSYAAKVISGLEGNFVRKQQPGVWRAVLWHRSRGGFARRS